MAVITRFIVIRNGVELEKVFDVKKEAEAYDKMLDAADTLAAFIKKSDLEVDLDEATIDNLSIFLAKNGPKVSSILKGVKPYPPPVKLAVRNKPVEKPSSKETNLKVTVKDKRK